METESTALRRNRSADFQVCCFQTRLRSRSRFGAAKAREPFDHPTLSTGRRLTDLEIGDTAGLETCATTKCTSRAASGRPTGFATRWFGLCLLGLLLCSAGSASGQTAAEAWVRRASFGESSSEDFAVKVMTDSDGNVIVAGISDEGTTAVDILVIKYSGVGVPLWTNRYDGPAHRDDIANAIAVDGSGNVFVTGQSAVSESNSDYVTLAYSGAGAAIWTNYYNGPGNNEDHALAMAVNGSGNVLVTGYSIGVRGNADYATIAYSGAGIALWTNRYNGPGNLYDQAKAVAVDGNGNVFVTGESAGSGGNLDYATIAYSGAGVALWTNRYSGPGISEDSAIALAVNNSGRVFVTGYSIGNGPYRDYLTIAYTGAGVALWTNRFLPPLSGTATPSAIAVDGNNVFVTGSVCCNGTFNDYTTIAYSGAGLMLWTGRYDGPGHSHDSPSGIAVDNGGNVIVTGTGSGIAGGEDYTTIKYSGAGVARWTNRYDGVHSVNRAVALALDNNGNVFVTGYEFNGAAFADFATLAYSGAGLGLWTNRYNGPGNALDVPNALAVGNSGRLFVTGALSDKNGGNDFVTIAYSDAGVALWTNRFVGPGDGYDEPNAVALDNSENVFVTGVSTSFEGFEDYATIAYSRDGVALWTNRFDGEATGPDQAHALAVDRGKVYVTGYSLVFSGSGFGSFDYATIAYSTGGVPFWTNFYDGTGNADDYAMAMAVDRSSGSVVVTGFSHGLGSTLEYATISYSDAGVALWTNRYSGQEDLLHFAYAVAVDGRGNVFVTGASTGSAGDLDYATIAYSREGVALWTNRYDGPANGDDQANAIAVDFGGNVFVTGYSTGNGSSPDYTTLAYSGAGVALWTNRYNGPGNGDDRANAVVVDSSSGYVIVSGKSTGSSDNFDYATIAYSNAGVPLWTNRYNGPANGYDSMGMKGLGIGLDGAVYVTGASDGSYGGDERSDFATVKYVWQSQLAIQPLTAGFAVVNLTLAGAPNSSWSIERATMMSGPWTRLGSSLIGPDGIGAFQDAHPPSTGAFYRARQP